MTPEDILSITKRNKKFSVSLRWRDIPLQKICNQMVREGKLKKVGRVHREIIYLEPKTQYRISKGGYLILTSEEI